MTGRVIVAGHGCIDITPVFPRTLKAGRLEDVLSPGRLLHMQGVDIHTGGAVSNTGLAMKLLGADAALMTKIGDDDFGPIIADIYGKYGVTEGLIIEEGGRTSYTVAIAVPGIDRIFLHDPGCNDTFSFEDLKKEMFKDAVLFHFGYPPLMKKMYENDGEELLRIMRWVKEQGAATSLDLAFVDEASDAGRADWQSILKKVLPYIDFFVPSAEELCFMLDRKRFGEWEKRAEETGKDIVSVLDPQKDVQPLAERCIDLGAKAVLIKCGAPGLFYRTAFAQRLDGLQNILGISPEQWGDRSGFEKSYIPEKVLSGTGAGDTTIAAFLTAVLSGYDFEMCVHLAAAEGASCVEAYDALGGIKPLRELEERIKAGWEKAG